MADIKQTIYNIERCTCHVPDACRDCSFSDDKTGVNKDCIDALLCDALDVIKSQQAEIEAFLREKEPFMFEWHDGGDDIY